MYVFEQTVCFYSSFIGNAIKACIRLQSRLCAPRFC